MILNISFSSYCSHGLTPWTCQSLALALVLGPVQYIWQGKETSLLLKRGQLTRWGERANPGVIFVSLAFTIPIDFTALCWPLKAHAGSWFTSHSLCPNWMIFSSLLNSHILCLCVCVCIYFVCVCIIKFNLFPAPIINPRKQRFMSYASSVSSQCLAHTKSSNHVYYFE